MSHLLNLFLSVNLFLCGVQSAHAGPSGVDHPQGALWHLVESGQTEKAQELKSQLTKILLESEVHKLIPIRVVPGSSQSYFVEFPGNIYAILKEPDVSLPDSHLREVAVYRLDQLLNLNMVPLTVARMIDGKPYSLQLYYPHGGEQDRLHSGQVDDLRGFDFLINNRDRAIELMHNVLQGRDGRIVAFDNAQTLQGRDVSSSEALQLSEKFLNALSELSYMDVVLKMKGLISLQDVSSLWARVQKARQIYVAPAAVPLKAEAFAAKINTFQFVRPAEFGNAVFFDALAVVQKIRQGSRSSFADQDFKLIEKQKLLATGVILQDWFSYEPQVRAQFLNLLWGTDLKDFAQFQKTILLDMVSLDPDKGAALEAHSKKHAMSPSAAATIQCSQVFAQ